MPGMCIDEIGENVLRSISSECISVRGTNEMILYQIREVNYDYFNLYNNSGSLLKTIKCFLLPWWLIQTDHFAKPRQSKDLTETLYVGTKP